MNTCSASVRDASGRNSHVFYVDVDSNPEVVLFRSHAEWRSVLSAASGASTAGISCMSCTWLGVCMMKGRG